MTPSQPEMYLDASGNWANSDPTLWAARSGQTLPVALEVDNVEPWLVTVDGPHHEIHESEAFSLAHSFSLASSGVGYLQLIVPATTYPHLRLIGANADSEKWKLELIEAPTITDGSTAVVFRNRNRNSTGAATVVAYSNPTSVSAGTTIDTHYLGGGTGQGQSKSGGATSVDEEFILKAGTKYVLKATNGGVGAGICNVRLFYYGGGSA